MGFLPLTHCVHKLFFFQILVLVLFCSFKKYKNTEEKCFEKTNFRQMMKKFIIHNIIKRVNNIPK